MEIGSFFGLVFSEKLSPFVWQVSFTFVIDERLACYLITELLAVTLLLYYSAITSLDFFVLLFRL